MMRRPPISTLFPSTTLFRSVGVRVLRLPPAVPGHEERGDHVALHRPGPEQRDVDDDVLERLRAELADQLPRSEEHTSELQSRQYLVCRLLLEKKKHMP